MMKPKRLVPLLASAGSGLALALALPLVVQPISLRELDPAGRLELLAWVALVPAFLALRAAPTGWAAFRRGLLAGLAFFFAAIHWVSHAMTEFGRLPLWLSLVGLTLLVLYMAVHWAVAFAVSWTIRARLGWPLVVHLPFVWTALELSRNYLFSGFPWGNLGYTQVRTLPVAQLAALGGVYAIAALVAAVNAALADAIAERRAARPLPWRSLAAVAALLALTVGHGVWRLGSVRARMAAAPALSVGIVQPNVDQGRKNKARDNRAYILSRLVPPTVEADEAGAELVVWPEASYPIYLAPGLESLDLPGAAVPKLARAHLLMGAATLESFVAEDGRLARRVGNVNLLLSPDLDVLGVYQKNHLVPFGEYVPLKRWLPWLGQVVPSMAPSAPGQELRVLEFEPTANSAPTANPTAATANPTATPTPTPTANPTATATANPTATPAAPPPVRLAPMICFDAIFPEINVEFAGMDPEPDVLVNTTNDAWYGYSSGPYQFLAIVRMRAIEAGKAVVRSAYAGVSAVILPTGEVAPGAIEVGPVDADLAPDPAEPPRLLLADVPRLRGRTPYTTVGDLFAWASSAFAAAALVAAWRAGRRRPRAARAG
jgi:apolipoprotein N-acyltransferase